MDIKQNWCCMRFSFSLQSCCFCPCLKLCCLDSLHHERKWKRSSNRSRKGESPSKVRFILFELICEAPERFGQQPSGSRLGTGCSLLHSCDTNSFYERIESQQNSKAKEQRTAKTQYLHNLDSLTALNLSFSLWQVTTADQAPG